MIGGHALPKPPCAAAKVMAECACGNRPIHRQNSRDLRRPCAARRKADSCELGLPLVPPRMRSGRYPGKILWGVLAEIYAAISYALAILEEVSSEIEKEDRLSSRAAHSGTVEPARS